MRPPRTQMNPRPYSTLLPASAKDETLPAPRRSLEVRRFSSAELRSIRFLVATSALTSIVLSLVAVLGFQLLKYVNSGAAPEVGAQCEEGEGDTCPEGQSCIGRRCVTVRAPRYCQIGDPCPGDRCEAEPTLRCGDKGKYVMAQALPDQICADPRVQGFLTEVGKQCGSLKACETSQLADFAISHEDFLEVMMSFPGAVQLHFDKGKPNSRPWPAAIEAHYVEELKGTRKELEAAKSVLLVALSSRDTATDVPGATPSEDALTLRRAQEAEKLARAALGPTATAAELDRLDEKFKFVLIGKRKQLDREFYNEAMIVRSVAWDRKNQNKLRGLIRASDPLTAAEQRWRDLTINQAVFIVPIPCGLGDR